MALVDTILSAGSPEELQPAWELFFLNKKAVAEALERPREDVPTLLAKGALVNQTQHTTNSVGGVLGQARPGGGTRSRRARASCHFWWRRGHLTSPHQGVRVRLFVCAHVTRGGVNVRMRPPDGALPTLAQ